MSDPLMNSARLVGEKIAENILLQARIRELEAVFDRAVFVVIEYRREFARGDLSDCDALEDALLAAGWEGMSGDGSVSDRDEKL